MNDGVRSEKTHITPGERVKEERKRRGLTQEELAERIKVPANYISMIETGSRHLTVDKAKKLSDVFAPMRYQYLLCDDDFKTESDLSLWNLANEVVSRDSLFLALKTLATENDYWITTPRSFIERVNSLGVSLSTEEIIKAPYIIKHNDRLLSLSDKKMESLCKLVSDFVRIQLEYLFTTENLMYSGDSINSKEDGHG